MESCEIDDVNETSTGNVAVSVCEVACLIDDDGLGRAEKPNPKCMVNALADRSMTPTPPFMLTSIFSGFGPMFGPMLATSSSLPAGL